MIKAVRANPAPSTPLSISFDHTVCSTEFSVECDRCTVQPSPCIATTTGGSSPASSQEIAYHSPFRCKLLALVCSDPLFLMMTMSLSTHSCPGPRGDSPQRYVAARCDWTCGGGGRRGARHHGAEAGARNRAGGMEGGAGVLVGGNGEIVS